MRAPPCARARSALGKLRITLHPHLAQRAGQIRALLASPAVVMSLISLCIFPFIATPLVSGVLGIRVDEAHVATLADHHWTLFLHGVEEAQ